MNSHLRAVPIARPASRPKNQTSPKCWLIGDASGLFPIAAAEVARLRGLELELCRLTWAGNLPARIGGAGQLIALNFDLLGQLRPEEKQRLKKWVESGATLFLRGGLQPGRRYSLAPISDVQFEYSNQPSHGYQLSTHRMLPLAIAGERVERLSIMPCALHVTGAIESMLLAQGDGNTWLPSIFTIPAGDGAIICDLNVEDDDHQTSLLAKLSDPMRLAATIGPLAAVDWAAGRDLSRNSAVNLVIDDRPINHDYFSNSRTEVFLRHWDSELPGVHVDYAWTPSHSHPHRRYVNLLQRYNTGFVWHGFLRHVDHRKVNDPVSEYSTGRELIEQIERNYGVHIQPVMIFPFEKDTPSAVELLRHQSFIAKVQSFDYEVRVSPPPNYYRLRHLQQSRSDGESFAVIFRDAIEMLSRGRMLALATLGMPIIAIGHPRNLALRRFGRLRDSMQLDYFDPVLKFATEKSLRPMSLETIAAEVPLES
jgi:hypothetical protein